MRKARSASAWLVSTTICAIVILTCCISCLADMDVSGVWRHGTTETWTFTLLGDGKYQAQETGFGNAAGIATVSGNVIRVEYTTKDGRVTGTYDIKVSDDGSRGEGVWKDSSPSTGTRPFIRMSWGSAGMNISGVWRHGTTETWTFTHQGDGTYMAQETGFGNAAGTATVSNNVIRIAYTTKDGRVTGTYEITVNADGSRGEGVWRDSSLNTGTRTFIRVSRGSMEAVPDYQLVGVWMGRSADDMVDEVWAIYRVNGAWKVVGKFYTGTMEMGGFDGKIQSYDNGRLKFQQVFYKLPVTTWDETNYVETWVENGELKFTFDTGKNSGSGFLRRAH